MKFVEHSFPKLERLDTPEGRRYRTPEGNIYPSVTTVLSSGDNTALSEWRDKVGHEEADKISRRAADKGTKVHEACENYLKGVTTVWGMFDKVAQEQFQCFIPVLDEIEEVHAMETQMYTDTIKVAGTVDLIVRYKGKLCIMDWKTSRRYKSAEEIESYFMQLSVYALMFYERTGIAINDTCVQMAVEDHGLETFHEKVTPWLGKFNNLRRSYRERFGI